MMHSSSAQWSKHNQNDIIGGCQSLLKTFQMND